MAKKTKLCLRALETGICHNLQCPFDHNIPFCDACRLMFSSEADHRVHLASSMHRTMTQSSTSPLRCAPCDKVLVGSIVWKAHVASGRHVETCREHNVDPQAAGEPIEVLDGFNLCTTCRAQIPKNAWRRHQQNSKHLRRLRYEQFAIAMEKAEADKGGIVVEGSCDFGVVKAPSGRHDISKPLRLRCDDTKGGIRLADWKLHAVGKEPTFKCFIPTANRVFNYLTIIPAQVSIVTKFNGRFTARLDFTFENIQTKRHFVISRELSVHVGNKSDLDALKSSKPFVSTRPLPRQPVTKVTEGGIPPALGAIPYESILHQEPIPSYLRDILLSKCSVKEALRQLRGIYVSAELSMDTYVERFKNLLWIEEHQLEMDLHRYDMQKARMSHRKAHYYLDVPGLAEKRPSVMIRDKIHVQHSNASDGHWFSGGVHVIHATEVGIQFHKSFKMSQGDTFRVRFQLNRIPLRRQHQGISSRFSEERVLFPRTDHVLQLLPRPILSYFNSKINGNLAQCQAIDAILRSPPGSPPFIVYGPPGTGKTVTIVEAIKQLVRREPGARILVCAPSNSAADLVTIRLTDTSQAGALTAEDLFRAIAPSRSEREVAQSVLPFTYRNNAGYFSVQKEKMKNFRIVISTCVSSSIVSGIGIPRGHYSHIFIDEAGQATETELMVAVKQLTGPNTNVVLSGDPKQLGPVIRSAIARELGFGKSYLERLMENDVYDEHGALTGHSVVKLVKNFRSHHAILRFPSERFYTNDLEACADPTIIDSFLHSQHLVSPNFPVVFQAISGRDDRESTSPSFFNIDEAILVKEVVEKLLSDSRVHIEAKDIGVIAPYRAQCKKIRVLLKSFAAEAKVGSVEEFQGQERKVIIVSTVRSTSNFLEYDLRHNLGFVSNPRRFNVAMTRAQALLIVIGDPGVLSPDPLWRAFLNYVYQNGGWKGPEPTWDTAEPVDDSFDYAARIRQDAEANMQKFTQELDGGNEDMPFVERE